MTTVSVSAPGLREAIASVDAAAKRARDLGPVLNVIAVQIDLAIKDSFRTSTDFAGVRFAPNAPATIKKKKSSKPMRDTGRLEESISSRPTGRTAIGFGTNVSYAAAAIAGGGKSGTRRHTSYGLKPGRVKGIRGNAGLRQGPRQQLLAGTTYTASVRNPFPVSMSGNWIDVGRGSVLRAKITRTLVEYIQSGRAG